MRRQRGIALVLVLWVTVLLSVIVGSFTLVSRVETMQARNQLDVTRAYFAAEAGLHRAVAAMNVNDPQRQWVPDGRAYEMKLADADVEIRVVDESGRIDLNAAQLDQLVTLFESTGMERQRAEEITDAILDWRDPDDLVRMFGAEDPDYEAAGYGYGAKDAPFDTVEELQQVMGMNYELYQQVEPAVTVYSGRSEVNLNLAPREVLLAQPGLTAELVDQYLAERERAGQDGQGAGAPTPLLPGAGSPVARGGSLTYSVESRATLPNGASSTLEAVVRLHSSPAGRPFSIVRWKENDFSSEAPESPDGGEDGDADARGPDGGAPRD